jgi:gliding motility-associated-like protein
MKGMFFIFLFLLVLSSVQAQPVDFKWVKQMGGTSSGWGGWGNSVTVDALGNVYSTGIFTTGTIDADPGPGVFLLTTGAGEAMFISKVNAAGDLVWAKQMSGNEYTLTRGHSVTVDAEGNVYTTGSFYGGEVDFDPGTGVYTLKAETEDMFVSKLDACGNFVWVKQVGGTKEDHVIGYSIALDASGNIYTIGSFDGYAVDLDPGPGTYIFNTDYNVARVFVSKLDATGKFVWAKQMEAIGDGANFYGSYGLAVALDLAGNVYITGYFAGTVDFDPGPNVFALSTDYGDNYICKLNSSGDFKWARQAGQSSESYVTGNAMAVDPSGNVYTTGFFNGTVDFDPGPGVFNLSAVISGVDRCIYVSKLNASGNFIWAKKIGEIGPADFVNDYPPQYSSIALDAAGNVYTTGPFSRPVDFDPGTGVYNLVPLGAQDVFVTKMDAGGTFVWAKQMGGNGTANSSSIAADMIGNVYIEGAFKGTIDFDPGPGVHNITSIGTVDHFIHKLAHCTGGITSSTITASTCGSYILNCIVYTASGVYTQTFLNTAGCDSVVTLNLAVRNSNPPATINVTACDSYTWNGQTLVNSGTYTDTLVAASGCDSICTLQLTVLSKPAPNLGADKNLCPGDTLVLYPGEFDNYQWLDGSTQNRMTITQPGLYSVVVTNACGNAKDEVMVNKEGICDIYFSSAFTPNNDGINDLFKILGAHNLSYFHLLIYNRWGETVFESSDYTKGWDGKSKGRVQQSGVYVWYCDFKKRNTPGNTVMKGTVMLIR